MTSANKVGILPKPDIEAEVKDYLKPGTSPGVTSSELPSLPPNMDIYYLVKYVLKCKLLSSKTPLSIGFPPFVFFFSVAIWYL